MAAADEDVSSAGVECGPCRATGRVVSNLGGQAHEVPCPWCDGSGRRPAAEHDAQAAAREGRASEAR